MCSESALFAILAWVTTSGRSVVYSLIQIKVIDPISRFSRTAQLQDKTSERCLNCPSGRECEGVCLQSIKTESGRRQVGQCSTLADQDRYKHTGGGSGTANVSWQRAVSRSRRAFDTGRSPPPVRSPLTMATGSSTVHVNNMEINRGKTQTSANPVEAPTAASITRRRWRSVLAVAARSYTRFTITNRFVACNIRVYFGLTKNRSLIPFLNLEFKVCGRSCTSQYWYHSVLTLTSCGVIVFKN